MKFGNRKIRVILSEEAATEYNELKISNLDIHLSILKSIDRVKHKLKENPFAGIQIRKSQIPEYYIKKYGVTNLWKMNLSGFWRMIYTIKSTEIEIINFVLDIFDHKKYNKKFGYKKK